MYFFFIFIKVKFDLKPFAGVAARIPAFYLPQTRFSKMKIVVFHINLLIVFGLGCVVAKHTNKDQNCCWTIPEAWMNVQKSYS